jgi:hypothetical protein
MAPAYSSVDDEVNAMILTQLDLYHPSVTDDEKTARQLVVRIMNEPLGDWYTEYLETVPYPSPLDSAIALRIGFVRFFAAGMAEP